ncbi:MAG: hypothetical protein JWQ40_562 [Segetibacter sp.]|nr:hypothetical protein [Segetibacter sp.]
MPTTHLIIKGKVQGVFYRATAKEIAEKCGVTGWIKNTLDGNVEATITGTEEQLDQFANWCKKGPARAKVTEVVSSSIAETIFNDFTVIRSDS